MVRLEMLVSIKPENRFEFTQTFELMYKSDIRPQDCIGQMLFESVEGTNTFLWVEDWTTTESLEAYQEKQHYKSLLGAITVLGSLVSIYNFTLEGKKAT